MKEKKNHEKNFCFQKVQIWFHPFWNPVPIDRKWAIFSTRLFKNFFPPKNLIFKEKKIQIFCCHFVLSTFCYFWDGVKFTKDSKEKHEIDFRGFFFSEESRNKVCWFFFGKKIKILTNSIPFSFIIIFLSNKNILSKTWRRKKFY